METEQRDRLLLVYLGASMIAGGQPSNEVEDEMRRVGAQLGYPRVQAAASPTGMTLSLASGSPASFEGVEGDLRLDQSAAVHRVRLGLATGTLSPGEAVDQLGHLRQQQPRVASWLRDLGWLFVSGGLAMILAPGLVSVIASALLGLGVGLLVRLLSPHALLRTILPTAAAFLVSLAVFALANYQLLDDPLRTILPPIAILLPGGLLVTGMSELASGHMMAGTSRLTFGGVQLLLFTLGVVGAAAILQVPADAIANRAQPTQTWPLTLIGLVLIIVGILLYQAAPVALFGWVGLVVLATFGAQVTGQQLIGSVALGGLLGGIVASFGALVIELIRPKIPRLVVFLPSFWLLVPGSLGLLGFAGVGLRNDSISQALMSTVATVAAIALGVLLGAALASLPRAVVQRRRARRPKLRAA